jgi:signal transduction histidine kinase
VSAALRSAIGELRRAPDLDVALALAAFAALIADPLLLHKVSRVTPLMVVVALATAVPLVLRRRFPLAALTADVPPLLLCLALYHPNRAVAGITMLLVFTAGLEGRRTRSLVIGAVMALIVTAAVLTTSTHSPDATDYIAYTSLVLSALIVGDALRARQTLQRALAEEAVRAGEAAAQHRFDQERLALAHEVHDVVGHTLVAINVRAAAAAHRAAKTSQGEAGTVLAEIAAASAEALAELRTTLKALRAEQHGPAPLQPFQGLASLGDLIAGVHETGLRVALEVTGDPRMLPTPVGHAGYRIVQEGLTNVMRHSASRTARVRIAVEEHRAVIEIVDAGPARPSADPTPGHGLKGMRERTAALGGTCEAGPSEAAGWRVRATIPLTPTGSR